MNWDCLRIIWRPSESPPSKNRTSRNARAWARVGSEIPRPHAILAISAHWCTPGVGVAAIERPPTIHDFGAFPRATFEIQYPAPVRSRSGAPGTRDPGAAAGGTARTLLRRSRHVAGVVQGPPASGGPDRPAQHRYVPAPGLPFRDRRKLAPLRDEGMLMQGNGNVVHTILSCCGVARITVRRASLTRCGC